METIVVRAAYDPEAKVWYVESSNLPGLHIEADSPGALYDKLPAAITDLLELEGGDARDVSFELVTPGTLRIHAEGRRKAQWIIPKGTDET
jgi:Domain of unknown function (DUF1902)